MLYWGHAIFHSQGGSSVVSFGLKHFLLHVDVTASGLHHTGVHQWIPRRQLRERGNWANARVRFVFGSTKTLMEDWTAVRQKCTLNCLENNHNVPRHLLCITVKLSPLSQPALLPTLLPDWVSTTPSLVWLPALLESYYPIVVSSFVTVPT